MKKASHTREFPATETSALIHQLAATLYLELACYRQSGIHWLSMPGDKRVENPAPTFSLGRCVNGLVFVRQCPSAAEMQNGNPFSDAEGGLLQKIMSAMRLDTQEGYFTYLFKHPVDGAKVDPVEIQNHITRLEGELAPLSPRVVVSFGEQLSAWLTGKDSPIEDLRGREFLFLENIPLLASWSPGLLLRQPEYKKPVWQDMQKALQLLNSSPVS